MAPAPLFSILSTKLTGYAEMSLKNFIRLCKIRMLRCIFVRNIEKMVDMKLRHKDFNSMRDKICELGTDNLDYFGHSYSFEGGYYLQQNPDEFVYVCFYRKTVHIPII